MNSVVLLLAALFFARILQFRHHPNDQSRPEANQNANRHRTNTDELVHRMEEVFPLPAAGATLIVAARKLTAFLEPAKSPV